MKSTIQVPRTVCEVGMYLTFERGAEIPVRLRDDLDPCDPPAEYANGRVSWSGYANRGERDAARSEKAKQAALARERQRRERDNARDALQGRLTAQAWARIKAGGLTYARTDYDVHGFSCCVAPHNENRAAHGNIVVREYANAPHVSRAVNVNGSHREEGAWQPDTASIRAEVDSQLPRL